MINASILLSVLAGAAWYLSPSLDSGGRKEPRGDALRAVSVPVEAHGLKANVTLIVSCSWGEIRILDAYTENSVLECTDDDGLFIYRVDNETDLCVQAEDIGDGGVPADDVYRRVDVQAHLSECCEKAGEEDAAWVVPCDALGKSVLGTPKVRLCREDAHMMNYCRWVFHPSEVEKKHDAGSYMQIRTIYETPSDPFWSAYCRKADFEVAVSCELPEDICVYRLNNVTKAKQAFRRKSCTPESPDKLPWTLCELMDNGMTFERVPAPTRTITLVGRAKWVVLVCHDDEEKTLRRRVYLWLQQHDRLLLLFVPSIYRDDADVWYSRVRNRIDGFRLY